MRRAIIADICANLVALEAVLADIEQQSVDDIVCLGGIVGYGPDPVECVELVKSKCVWSLGGRLERAVVDPDSGYFGNYYKKAFDWQRARLRRELDWLRSLQNMRIENSIQFAYASPRNPVDEPLTSSDFCRFEGQYPMVALDNFAVINSVFFGANTHKPFVCVLSQDAKVADELPNMSLVLEASSKVFVNVGSVGQPRDSIPKSCYLIYDSDKKFIQFRRIPYNIPAAIRRFKQHPEIHERFWMRLEKGL